MSTADTAPPIRFTWLIVGVACMSGFMGQLDASIVQLALPALARSFDSTVTSVRWIAVAYLLAYASFVLVFSRISQMYGRKRVFLLGMGIFTVGSLFCGLAPGLDWLIFFRALQGVGGAMLGANSISLILQTVTTEQRGQAIGALTASQAVGVSAGPIVGGLLLDWFGWPWIFWATVPFGCAAVLLGAVVLVRTPPSADSARRFDWAGTFWLVLSLPLFILTLNQLSVWPLLSPAMLACIAGTVLCMTLFVRRERSTTHGLIDLGLFHYATFTRGLAGVVLANALLYGMFFLMSFALIHGLHETARISGLKLAVIPAAIGTIAPLSALLAARWGDRILSATGMVLCTAAVAALSIIALKPAGTLVQGLAIFAVFGFGLGLFVGPNNHRTADAVPPDRTGEAGALLNLSRVLGGCIGISSASSLMSWRLAATGGDELTALFSGLRLLAAIEGSLVLLAAFAMTAAVTSLIRSRNSA